jgi:photosystem II stability/assembly factor-like uncharacterized protein
MKVPRSGILGLLTILLLAAAALPLASLRRSSQADRERGEANDRKHEGENTPPEDSFVTQRVVHGGIPVGALEKAHAQAAALTLTTRRSDPQLATTKWQFVGPTNIGGRVVDIAVDPVASNTIYVAAATGGVWKSTDQGAQFTSIWPATNPQAMGALVIASNGTLFAGTGEANPGGGSITYGGSGVYRSVDGGGTWQRVGLTNSGAIGRLAVDPTNSQNIFAAATGDLFNPGGERGVYKSIDGGSTWTRVLTGDNDTTGAVDLAIDPLNPNRVFAAMWDHLREPNLRRYGGMGSGMYRSTDGGSSWQRLTNGLPGPAATIGRIGVALAASNPQRVYAIVNQTSGPFQGFYRSDDGGDSWTNLSPNETLAGEQASYGWWFGRVWVDPLDQAHVFAAGVFLCESQDSGSSFTGQSSPHADHHAMAWDLKVPGRVYLGNDGGTYRSDVNGSNNQWTAAIIQPFTQFYSVDVSEQDESRIVGGTQDNGVLRSYGGTAWNSYVGGDGEEALIDPVNQDLVYGCSQYGVCRRSTNGGNSTLSFGATVSSRRNWFTPLQFDPTNPAVLYYAGDRVNRSTDNAAHWSVISPNLTGGPGPDPSYPFGTVTTVAGAKTDPNRVLAGTDDGRLWFTTNLGVDWTRVTDSDVPGTWVTRVMVDPINAQVAYATFSGFRSGAPLPYVLKTIDGGATWASIAGDLPQAPVNDIVIVNSTLYVGTDVGVFRSIDGGATWLTAGEALPNVPVTDLEYRAASNSLYAATFGRGIFVLPLPTTKALNISTRVRVQTGDNVMIGGFIITGSVPKNVAVRGVGPSLGNLGLSDVLANPTLELRDSGGALLAQNDNWQDDPAQAALLTTLGLALQDPNESGIVVTLSPGASYTAIVAGKNGGTGVGLVEVYDTNPAADAQLANISTRGFVENGSNVMIGGFILGGGSNTSVALRGIGPSLGQFGLSPVLADPTLELHDGNGALLISNDDWQTDAASAAQLSAHGLAPQDTRESGIFASLPPGAFTAILAGKNGATGLGLVEIYNVP